MTSLINRPYTILVIPNLYINHRVERSIILKLSHCYLFSLFVRFIFAMALDYVLLNYHVLQGQLIIDGDRINECRQMKDKPCRAIAMNSIKRGRWVITKIGAEPSKFFFMTSVLS